MSLKLELVALVMNQLVNIVLDIVSAAGNDITISNLAAYIQTVFP